MVGSYYYRGTSLSSAVEEELGAGQIEGFTASIYKGELAMHDPQSHVPRETHVSELEWRTPPGEDRGYLTDSQGVTGGLTHTIGTAIGFSSGVPLVLYLRQRDLNGAGVPVRYGLDWFDSYPGGLAWVAGDVIEGEVRDINDGLIGLTTATPSGPVVWQWGGRDLDQLARTYEDEREVLVFEDHIDLSAACESVAIMLEGRRTPTQALATFDGYHAGFGGGDETDVSRWSAERVLSTLHDEVRDKSPAPLPDLWTINLTSSVMGRVERIPEDIFDFAYSDARGRLGYDATPDHLLGG